MESSFLAFELAFPRPWVTINIYTSKLVGLFWNPLVYPSRRISQVWEAVDLCCACFYSFWTSTVRNLGGVQTLAKCSIWLYGILKCKVFLMVDFLIIRGGSEGTNLWLRYYSVKNHTRSPAWALVKLEEVSPLDNIFFCWGIRPQSVPSISPSLPGPPLPNMEPFQLLQRSRGKKVDSLLMAENKLAAGLPRLLSDNKAK